MVGGLRLHIMASSPMNAMVVGSGGGLYYRRPPLRVNSRFNNSNRSLFRQSSLPPSDTAAAVVLSSTVGFNSSWPASSFTHRQIRVLSFGACAAAVSAAWLFCSAIPALLAFKRAAESMEKLMDVAREELPGTMASIRLSGAEISDLTMELSDLGQEITRGVRNSTRVVRVVEENLTKLTNMNQSTPPKHEKTEAARTKEPGGVARTARGIREGIVRGRGVFQTLFTLVRFIKMVLNYSRTRALVKSKGQGV